MIKADNRSVRSPQVDELYVSQPALGVHNVNYLVHTSPFDKDRVAHYHWHVEVLPKMTNFAGFEWGTGFYVNPVPPEESAYHLKQCGGTYRVAGQYGVRKKRRG